MSRAEKRALEAYPTRIDPTACDCDMNEGARYIYQQGYEQAEKDTIERAVKWLSERAWTSAIQIAMFRKHMEGAE